MREGPVARVLLRLATGVTLLFIYLPILLVVAYIVMRFVLLVAVGVFMIKRTRAMEVMRGTA